MLLLLFFFQDPKFVFKLYRARKQYREAAKTAIIIANEEMLRGMFIKMASLKFKLIRAVKFKKAVLKPLENKTRL